MRNKQFWGLTLILISLTLIANAFGIYETDNLFTIAWSIVLIAFALSALYKRNLITASIAIGFVLFINREALNIVDSASSYIIPSSFLLGLGLSMLLPKKKHKFNTTFNKSVNINTSKGDEINESGDHITIENNLGDSIRYLNSSNLTTVNIENNLGACRVYFDQATFNKEGCTIYVENNLGQTQLYFPKDINIQTNISSTLGSVNGDKSYFTGDDAPNIFLNGESNLGEIRIYYI